MVEKINPNHIVASNCIHMIRIMKISVGLLFLGIFSLYAENVYSQPRELSLNLKNTTIRQAFSEIEKNSDYVFMVSDEAERSLDKKIDIAVQKGSIDKILYFWRIPIWIMQLSKGKSLFLRRRQVPLRQEQWFRRKIP